MTSLRKGIVSVLFAAICVLALISGLVFNPVDASTECLAETQAPTSAYYGENLVTNIAGVEAEYTLAKSFYRALEEINASGDFKKGRFAYDLGSVLTSAQIAAWVNDGNAEIPKAFGAARDSFLMDHPELFYVDLYKLTISAARANGVYSATIDCGRAANAYRDDTYKNETEVNQAIEKFNAAVKKVADDAAETVDSDNSDTERDLALAIAVNEIIATETAYDFKTYDSAIQNPTDVKADALTYTAYGALVDKLAVCSGYSLAYKAVLDRLEIPCIVVSGYSKGKNKNGTDTENNVGHSWNYVYLKTAEKEIETASRTLAAVTEEQSGAWFAFDTTWNSVCTNKNKYSKMNAISASANYIPNGVVSSSNYSLKYPGLSALNYEKAANPNEMDFALTDGDFAIKVIYQQEDASVTNWTHLSYKGKNATKLLAEDNMRMLMREFKMVDGKKVWSNWLDVTEMVAIYTRTGEITGYYDIDDAKTACYGNTSFHYAQYAIVSGIEPDGSMNLYGYNIGYADDEKVEEHAIYKSQPIENEAYGTYTPAPYLNSEKTTPYSGGDITINDSMSEPGNSSIVADSKAILFTAVYDEPLHVLNPDKDIEVYFTPDVESVRQYAGFATFSDGKYVHLVADSNGVYNTLQFKFKPSLMYEHNREAYTITFGNVGSAKIIEKRKPEGGFERTTSDKEPFYLHLRFSRVIYACPKVFGDGRLWIECCAQPTLVDNSDLSAMDFKDESGESTFTESARSQMMLVVNNVKADTKNAMLDEISSNSSINVNKDEIKASQTYDINLQMCGKIAKIPDGSYVKIALGFPEGYGPGDEGVTFKLFHRKHIQGDEYKIEEVPCVVTKFGIVATVSSFSPYMVAVVPETKATSKTVYASIDGKGGKLTKEDGKIQTVAKNGSYTYTISPDEGYKVYSITLNGADITSRVANGRLTVNYDELTRNNELEIKYISDESAVYFQQNNIVEPVKIIMSTDSEPSKYSYVAGEVFDEPSPSLSAGAIAGIVIGVLALVGIAVAVVLIVLKKKKGSDNKTSDAKTDDKKPKVKKATAKKASAKKPTTKKAEDNKKADAKTADKKEPDAKAADKKTTDKKPAVKKASAKKPTAKK